MAKKKKPLTEKDIPDWLNPTERQLAKMFMHLDPLWDYPFDYKVSAVKYSTFEGGSSLHLSFQRNTFKELSERLDYYPEYDAAFQDWKNNCTGYWLDELGSLHNPFRHPKTGEPCITQYDDDGIHRIKDWGYYSSNYATNFDQLFYANYYDDLVILDELDPHLFLVNRVYLHDVRKNPRKLFDDSVIVYCPNCESTWDYSDNRYRGSSDNRDLEQHYLHKYGSKGEVGTVVIRRDGLIFCPVCGKGVLN